MSNNENKFETMLKDWDHFKKLNDERLEKLEKFDPIKLNELDRVGKELDSQKSKIMQIEKSLVSANGMIIKNSVSSEHKSAINEYLRKGQESGLADMDTKALSRASDPDGGYLVSGELAEQIQSKLTEISPIRQLAAVTNISSDALDIIEESTSLGAGWTSEQGPINDTDTMTFNKKRILVNELYAQPKATQKLLDDSYLDIEAWLSTKLAEVFAQKENYAFINGDGNGKPRGFLSYTDGNDWGRIEQIKTGVSAGITADSLFSLYYSMKSAFAQQASFLMERTTIQAIRMLKDQNTGQYLWNPGLNGSSQATILGAPVYECADMPIASDGSLSIAFADFKRAYQVVDREGIRVLRDPFTDKPFVKFYTTKRVGGDVVNFEAIKLLRLGA